MKTKEVITEAGKVPDRIFTGYRAITVPNPYLMKGKGYSNQFAGNPDQHQFASKIQRNNYQRLKDILKRNGLKFNQFYASTYRGGADYIRRYGNPNAGANLETIVAVAGKPEAPTFVWHKYEGSVAGGGQNTVYVAGRAMKLTHFLSLNPAAQDRLLKAGFKKYTPKNPQAMKRYKVTLRGIKRDGAYRELVHHHWYETPLKGVKPIRLVLKARNRESAIEKQVIELLQTKNYKWANNVLAKKGVVSYEVEQIR